MYNNYTGKLSKILHTCALSIVEDQRSIINYQIGLNWHTAINAHILLRYKKVENLTKTYEKSFPKTLYVEKNDLHLHVITKYSRIWYVMIHD